MLQYMYLARCLGNTAAVAPCPCHKEPGAQPSCSRLVVLATCNTLRPELWMMRTRKLLLLQRAKSPQQQCFTTSFFNMPVCLPSPSHMHTQQHSDSRDISDIRGMSLNVPPASRPALSPSASQSSLRVGSDNDLRSISRNISRRNSESDSPLTTPSPRQPPATENDPAALALFQHWQTGRKLSGPHDFHSSQHYLRLYVMATKSQCEPLQNEVMDLWRGHYKHENLTAPAYRMEYIYKYTKGPNPMRRFLVASAAYRALSEQQTGSDARLSDSMRALMLAQPDIATDFAEALIALHKSDLADPRKGPPCE